MLFVQTGGGNLRPARFFNVARVWLGEVKPVLAFCNENPEIRDRFQVMNFFKDHYVFGMKPTSLKFRLNYIALKVFMRPAPIF